MQTLFYRILHISAKYHQHRSLQFRAIPFQSWAVFLRHSVCNVPIVPYLLLTKN